MLAACLDCKASLGLPPASLVPLLAAIVDKGAACGQQTKQHMPSALDVASKVSQCTSDRQDQPVGH